MTTKAAGTRAGGGASGHDHLRRPEDGAGERLAVNLVESLDQIPRGDLLSKVRG